MKKTVYLTSRQDGLKLHVLLMEPEQSPQGIVQICHGMAEHKERYESFMQMLCNNGYISVIHDHRGHGKSVKDEADLGYFNPSCLDVRYTVFFISSTSILVLIFSFTQNYYYMVN